MRILKLRECVIYSFKVSFTILCRQRTLNKTEFWEIRRSFCNLAKIQLVFEITIETYFPSRNIYY